MLNAITHSRLFVLDQDQAVDFYVGKLGMEISGDVDMGNMRWLTVTPPGSEQHLLLEKVPAFHMDESTAEQVRDLLTKGVLGMAIITTKDCRATYEELKAKGVEYVEEPTEMFYGIDSAIRDPFGNHIRVTQPNGLSPEETAEAAKKAFA